MSRREELEATQIERYRAMTGEQRLEAGFELTRQWRKEIRDNLHREFPEATASEIEEMFRQLILRFHDAEREVADKYYRTNEAI